VFLSVCGATPGSLVGRSIRVRGLRQEQKLIKGRLHMCFGCVFHCRLRFCSAASAKYLVVGRNKKNERKN
jgi:hypothetical protein